MPQPLRTKNTLSHRLVRALLVRLALVWLLCVLAVAFWLNHEIEENYDDKLEESAHRLFGVAMFQLEHTARGTPRAAIAEEPLFPDTPLVWQIVNAQGQPLLRSSQAPAQALLAMPTSGFHTTQQWRLYVAQHPRQALYFLLADALDERDQEWHEALAVLLVAASLALAALAYALPNVATREIKILQRLQQQIRARGAGDLRPLVLDGLPDELQAVGADVNRLLQRLTQALDVERALAANAAHELRTPLTTARLRLQTALEHGLHRSDIEAAVQALRTMGQRAEKLLQLSRAESSAPLSRQRVDLAQLAETVVQEFGQDVHAAGRLRLHLHPGRSDTLGDFDALAIALRNLMENALRHAGSGAVDVSVGPGAQLAVRDSGPGVDADRLHTLQQRHMRQGTRRAARQPGYGLGLSIVATIARKSAAQLALASPPAGQASGFEARLVLPAADRDAADVMQPPHCPE